MTITDIIAAAAKADAIVDVDYARQKVYADRINLTLFAKIVTEPLESRIRVLEDEIGWLEHHSRMPDKKEST